MPTSFWKEVSVRLKSESPKFFKTIRKWALYLLGGVGGAYFLLKTDTVDLPPKHEESVTGFLSYLLVTLVVITGGTFLPTMNKEVLQENAEDALKEDTIEKTKVVIADKMSEKVTDIKTETIKEEIDKKQ